MKKKICIVTATRAEYGLLRPIIDSVDKCEDFEAIVAVTGTHLSAEFGLTYHEILNDGIKIDRKIEILLGSDTPVGVSKSMGLAIISFSEYFAEVKPDALMVLGDRYEILAICCAAMNARIPIVHLHGGEATRGLIDEVIRHSITKMSYLHFTSADVFRKRVIQLGEDPNRVFNVGAIGIENALKYKFLSREELGKSIGFILDSDFAVITFHPVTLDDNTAEEQFGQLLKALDSFENMKYLFTKSNADFNGRIINEMIDHYTARHENAIGVKSLGTQKYLSALKECAMVIGNSSSGLIEAPSFKVPTINIGDRQAGRLQADSVLNCKPQYEDVLRTMKIAISDSFKKKLANVVNPYGDGHTSEKIISILKKEFIDKEVNLKKRFYDIDFVI